MPEFLKLAVVFLALASGFCWLVSSIYTPNVRKWWLDRLGKQSNFMRSSDGHGPVKEAVPWGVAAAVFAILAALAQAILNFY